MANIVLIGMPTSGKSTSGVILAKRLGYNFIDSDLLIQSQEGRLLHDIIEQDGSERFIQIEGDVNSSIVCKNTVIATGGSVIYSDKAMRHLKSIGKVFYLNLTLNEIEKRMRGKDMFARGVVMRGDVSSLSELLFERHPLYCKYADTVLNCSNQCIDETVCSLFDMITNSN